MTIPHIRSYTDSMSETLQDKDNSNDESKRGFLYPFIIIFLVLFFISGYFMRQSFEPSQKEIPQPIKTPEEKPKAILYESNSSTSPFFQKEYFNDAFIVVQKNAPYKSLFVSIDRIEQENSFIQKILSIYFDGNTWIKTSTTSKTRNNDIQPDMTLREFTNLYENNGSLSAQIVIKKNTLIFSSNQLRKEVVIASNGQGGQFVYQGTGDLLINGELSQVNIFHSREFSFDAAKVIHVIDPEHAANNRAVFWDKEGNFYFSENVFNKVLTNADKKFVHSVKIDSREMVTRTSDLKTKISNTKKGRVLTISLGAEINDLIQFPFFNDLEATQTTSFPTLTGEGKIIRREGRTVPGIGFVTGY